ncbi:hypothetical protein PoB_001310000 [Plakobranchus ocellatus]|uniref:Uncharacterized protein n=1 Tax=Plakobranchus ocellatus TaxID=259542 RepID=A0AAV3YUT2_9GAST|nr:hypothetical protein PoB_001310000 [Plakobranchus ocellatus]
MNFRRHLKSLIRLIENIDCIPEIITIVQVAIKYKHGVTGECLGLLGDEKAELSVRHSDIVSEGKYRISSDSLWLSLRPQLRCRGGAPVIFVKPIIASLEWGWACRGALPACIAERGDVKDDPSEAWRLERVTLRAHNCVCKTKAVTRSTPCGDSDGGEQTISIMSR